MLKILAIGSSHLQNIATAYSHFKREKLFSFKSINLNDALYSGWLASREPVYKINAFTENNIRSNIDSFKPDALFLSVGGNEYFIHSAIKDPRNFDFCLPDQPDLEIASGAEIVPYRLINTFAQNEIGGLYSAFKFLTEINTNVFSLGVPPPVKQDDFFYDNLGAELKAAARERGLSTPTQRYKMWHVCDNAHRLWCDNNGVTFIAPPFDTSDEDGFMRETYRGDAFHGSLQYSDKVLHQMHDAVSERISL